MKTLLPITITTLLVGAVSFPSIQTLFPKNEVPDIPFHTQRFSHGYTLPEKITGPLTVGPAQGIVLVKTSTIYPAGTLTILPGTTLAIEEYGAIHVYGTLHVQGEKHNKVSFISNESNEQNQVWSGIIAHEKSTMSVVHADIDRALPGITCNASGNASLEHVHAMSTRLDTYLCK